jgi:hypothetical protein
MLQPKKRWGWKVSTEKKAPGDVKKRILVLDKVFSQYIRLRDANNWGLCFCVTCGNPFHWKGGDAGHFIQRNRMAVRFDERNVNAQCKKCNRFDSGMQHDHGKAIDKKHGKGTADLLSNLGKVRGSKLDIYYVEEKITEYRIKIKQISCKLCNI